MQGTYPVISLSFGRVKETDYETTIYRICQFLMNVYKQYSVLQNCEQLTEGEKEYFERMTSNMSEKDAHFALYQLTGFLFRYYGKNGHHFAGRI